VNPFDSQNVENALAASKKAGVAAGFSHQLLIRR
jgi:hypothetical protein